VPVGDHEINFKKTFDNGSFIDLSNDINVTEDIDLQLLRLPKTIFLYDPLKVTTDSVILAWAPTDANDFQEYRVYRHTSPGLDENTGEFIYVSTGINDTSFIDNFNLQPSQTYYYRVYVMNNLGKMGGSNLISIKTKAVNIISNGDFEKIENNFPKDWAIYYNWGNDIHILNMDDTTSTSNGNVSIRAYLNALGDMAIIQKINPAKITPSKRYRMSFWLKINPMNEDGELVFIEFYDPNSPENKGGYFELRSPKDSSDWAEYSFEFTIIENTPVTNYFCVIGFRTEGSSLDSYDFNVLIDDIYIEIID
jgi:Carbohydrate binding domain